MFVIYFSTVCVAAPTGTEGRDVWAGQGGATQ